MALLSHHGLVGDDAARALMLCSAPIDAATAALKRCPAIPTRLLLSHVKCTATLTAHPPSHPGRPGASIRPPNAASALISRP
eukprot:7020382-Prymnesium_polylepis.2